MSKVFLRADDISSNEVMDYFVEKDYETECLMHIMSIQPVLVVGSRGTGKTMLLRVAHEKMSQIFAETHILPVYLSLSSAQFITDRELRIWMLHKILQYLSNELRSHGFNVKSNFLNKIKSIETNPIIEKLENYLAELNQRITVPLGSPVDEIDGDTISSDIDNFKLFAAELCGVFNIEKIVILFDEACQSFRPEQQRIFFDLFKDLRSPYIVCKAAVYPGLVSYGNFQSAHDAYELFINRDITSEDYIPMMREIADKYFPDVIDSLKQNGDVFDYVIACATGNPRFLIKTLELIMRKGKFNTQNVNDVIKDYYRNSIQSEHLKLADRYSGHLELINWGHDFVENKLIPMLDDWNDKHKDSTTLIFGIDRLTPAPIIHSIKILEYSGILICHSKAVRYRNATYDRYYINMGIYTSIKQSPVQNYKSIFPKLTFSLQNYPTTSPRDFVGAEKLREMDSYTFDASGLLNKALSLEVNELQLSVWTKGKLAENGYRIVRDVLEASDEQLQQIDYVGAIRSTRIRNEAYNAIIEYISG